MDANSILKTTTEKTYFKGWLAIIAFLLFQTSFAQNYRNARAYINDFGKNELFVKESLMEYSTAIIDASPDDRIQTTLERIYGKLEAINVNLLRNDKGIFRDTNLRDAFIKLNNKTIELLKNKSLKLNDYKLQSNLSYSDIFKNFSYKEAEVAKYYSEILAYESSKREFGIKYNILIRAYNKKNVFEYNSYQNLIFYRLNVLDDKLIQLLKDNDVDKVTECLNYMMIEGQDSFTKTDLYKDDFTDTSLNDANIEFITFMLNQKDLLLAIYTDYLKATEQFKKIKSSYVETNDPVSIENYNVEVRKYNLAKNLFFDTLQVNQIKKNDLLKRWYITNSDFLKNNIEFENLYEKFTNVD